jgi:hypothetical protein
MNLEHIDTVLSFVVIITGVSVLVTALTQMASALFALRGGNLRWGIETLLKNADPELAKYAKTISEQVLQHPYISDSTFSGTKSKVTAKWCLGSAIGEDELVEILHALAKEGTAPSAGGQPEPWAAALGKSMEALDLADAEKLLQLAPEIQKSFPDDAAKADEIISRLTIPVEELSGHIHQWFDSVMQRTSQRFATQTRLWTVLFSVALAFGLHLDAFKLFTQLSSDAVLRERLVASADALSKKADDILASTNGTDEVYVTAMKQLISSQPVALKGLPQPAGFTNLDEGKAWLDDHLKAINITDAAKWLQSYEDMVPQAPLRSAAENLRSILDNKLTLALVPDPYPQPFYNYWTPSWLHFWGVAASAVLLSLGAPFWFNTLKDLSNLRSSVANEQDPEPPSNAKT